MRVSVLVRTERSAGLEPSTGIVGITHATQRRLQSRRGLRRGRERVRVARLGGAGRRADPFPRQHRGFRGHEVVGDLQELASAPEARLFARERLLALVVDRVGASRESCEESQMVHRSHASLELTDLAVQRGVPRDTVPAIHRGERHERGLRIRDAHRARARSGCLGCGETFPYNGSLRVGTSRESWGIRGAAVARWRHCQIQVDTKRRIATVARPLLTRADARRAVTARAFSHARRLSEATGMATASNALYGVDVYSDSSEDSGNWESAGPRLSIGKRVDVSAPRKATENDLDAASVSSSDSEDDAMLVALVSAIACGADRPRVFDPYDPSRPDDSSGMARRGEACDSADDATDATAEDDDDEHSASSCSASSESEEVEETRPRRACFRTNPAPARTRTGSLGAIEVAFAATRPSPGGGRWGPPPRRGSHSRPGTAKASANAFAGPIPTVRAAVARAMAGALERKAAEAERALSSHSLSDARDGSARAKKAAVAAAAALDSRAEWARRQAIGYELEGARARGAYASPEKADHFSSRRRRAPSSAFAKAARTSPFDSATDFFVSGRRPEARARDRFSKSDLFRAPRLEPRTAPRTAQWKKPSVPRGRKPARAAGTKDESSSDESEADAWWTAPFGAVAAKKVRVLDDVSERKKRAARAFGRRASPPGDLGVAIDRTRPRPGCGAARASPSGPSRSRRSREARTGPRPARASARRIPSAGTPRRGGTGSAWPRRSGGAPPRRRHMGTQTRRIARRGPGARSDPPARRRAVCVVAAAC